MLQCSLLNAVPRVSVSAEIYIGSAVLTTVLLLSHRLIILCLGELD